MTDPNGNVTSYTYYSNGRVATVQAPGDTSPTQYFYVGDGCGSGCSGSGKIDPNIQKQGLATDQNLQQENENR